MINQSKKNCSTLLFCIAMSNIFLSFPATAEKKKTRLFNSIPQENFDDPQGMKSMSWNNSKLRKKEKEKISETKTNSVNIKTEGPDKDEDPKDSELWKKYKSLAAGNAVESKEVNTKKEAQPAEDKPVEEQAESNKSDMKPPATGIRGIMEAYKNSEEGKGKMNTRSFGSID